MQIDFDPRVDYYKALGVDKSASAVEIKRSYRKLAKQFHPDSTGGDKTKETRFKEISNAYEVLGDPTRRAKYDELRATGGRPHVGAGGFPGGGFPGAGFPGASGRGAGQAWDIGDLFASMFQNGAPRAGGQRSVRFEQSGDQDGWVFETRQGRPPEPAFEGRIEASDGSWLTVKGNDVYSDVRVSFDRAMLGTVAEVATVEGVSSVKIPPGTASGRRLRLRGKGVSGTSGTPGDHYVTVHLDVPDQLDEKGKRLLHELVQHLATQSGTKRSK